MSQVSIGDAQLPRQPHRLPGRSADRATTACSRPRSWSRSTGRCGRTSGCSARRPSRSRASVQRDSRFDHLKEPRSCAAASPARTGTTASPSRCSCSCCGSGRSSLPVLGVAAVDLYYAFASPLVARRRVRGAAGVRHSATLILVERARRWGSGALQPAVLLDLRPLLLAARAALEAQPSPSHRSTAPRSRACCGGCSACGSAGACSTTAARIPEKTLVTIGDDCHAQRGHRHPVPLAGGRQLQVRPHRRSATGAHSGSAPSCTTA